MALFVTNRMDTVTQDVNRDIQTHCATDVRRVFIKIFILSIHFVNKFLNTVNNIFFPLIPDCLPEYYGYRCEKNCSGHCLNNSICDPIDGICSNGCQVGYIGKLCKDSKIIWKTNCFLIKIVFSFLISNFISNLN